MNILPSDDKVRTDSGRKVVIKGSGIPSGTRILYVESLIHHRLKMRALQENLTMQQLTANVLSAYLIVPFEVAETVSPIDPSDVLNSVDSEVE